MQRSISQYFEGVFGSLIYYLEAEILHIAEVSTHQHSNATQYTNCHASKYECIMIFWNGAVIGSISLALMELFLCRLALLLTKRQGLGYTKAVFRWDSRGGKVLVWNWKTIIRNWEGNIKTRSVIELYLLSSSLE